MRSFSLIMENMSFIWKPSKNPVRLVCFSILASCTSSMKTAASPTALRSTMVDLSAVGDAAVFIDEVQLASIEKHTRRTGFLEGFHMKDMFSMMRENDLIWNYEIGRASCRERV